MTQLVKLKTEIKILVMRMTDDSEDEEDEEQREARMIIQDETETNLVNLRRTIYLTIMSSVDFEETGHKLVKIKTGTWTRDGALCDASGVLQSRENLSAILRSSWAAVLHDQSRLSREFR